MTREAREIWCVRGIGWALIGTGIYSVAMSWTMRDPASGVWGPTSDVVPFALITGTAFDLVGRVLARLRASAKPDKAWP